MSEQNKHPLISNDFPEYRHLSRVSKLLINGVRGAAAAAAVSLGSAIVGGTPEIMKDAPEIAAGGVAGFIGSVAVGAVLMEAYGSSTDHIDTTMHPEYEQPTDNPPAN